jgi:predicted esterase
MRALSALKGMLPFRRIVGRPRVVPASPQIMGACVPSSLRTNASTFTVTLPGGVLAGEALMAVITVDANPTVTVDAASSAGWVICSAAQSSVDTMVVAYNLTPPLGAAAVLVLNVGAASEQFSAVACRISGHAGAPSIRLGAQATADFAPNPPPSIPVGSFDPILVIAAMGANANSVPTAGPAGYTFDQATMSVASAAISADSVAIATRRLTANQEDPGAFTFTAGAARTWTVATIVWNAVRMAKEGAVTAPGTLIKTQFTSAEGVAREFTIREPINGSGPWPLFIMFHGGSNTNAVPSILSVDLDDLCEANGWMMVALQAVEGRWNYGGDLAPAIEAAGPKDDVTYVDEVIARIAADYPIHPTKRYLVGVSAGGAMAYRVACERPGVFPALAVVSSSKQDPQAAHAGTDVLHIHGTADTNIPINGGSDVDTGPGIQWRDPHLGPTEFAAAGNPSTTFTQVDGGTHDWYTLPLFDTNGTIAAFLNLH